MFPSVAFSPFIQLQNRPQIILLGVGVGHLCRATVIDGNRNGHRQRSRGAEFLSHQVSPQTCGLKLLKSRHACPSHHLTAMPSSGPPSVKGELLSWGLVWPRSPGDQAFRQLLTQSCPPSHPQKSVYTVSSQQQTCCAHCIFSQFSGASNPMPVKRSQPQINRSHTLQWDGVPGIYQTRKGNRLWLFHF